MPARLSQNCRTLPIAVQFLELIGLFYMYTYRLGREPEEEEVRDAVALVQDPRARGGAIRETAAQLSVESPSSLVEVTRELLASRDLHQLPTVVKSLPLCPTCGRQVSPSLSTVWSSSLSLFV